MQQSTTLHRKWQLREENFPKNLGEDINESNMSLIVVGFDSTHFFGSLDHFARLHHRPIPN